MNYIKQYNNIISNAKQQNRSKKLGYFEKHHIIPKSLGGDNSKENLVLLTAKEHFTCHHLLTKIHPSAASLKFAFWAMCNQLSGDVIRDYKVSSRTYCIAKRQFAIENSKKHKGKKWNQYQHKIHSERMKRIKLHKGGVESHLYGIPRTTDVINKISKTKKENPEKNAQFKGYYITPFGKFASVSQIQLIDIRFTKDIVRSRCKNPDSIITSQRILKNFDLDESMLGKNFRELGWGFLPILS
jgi:hypothetical protein